jgi:hypothetical protein
MVVGEGVELGRRTIFRLKSEENCPKVLLDHFKYVRQGGGLRRVARLESLVKSRQGQVKSSRG